MDRRAFIICTAATVLAMPALGAEDMIISPKEAHRRAAAGEVVLVDIRTKGEWQETGVGESAHAISMRDRDFLDKVDALTGGDKAHGVALICATGVRSAWLRDRLEQNGYSNVIDVSQGMLGNRRGKGWIAQGLPVRSYTE